MIERRLEELNLKLPEVPMSLGEFVPLTIHKDLVFVSGQVPRTDGKVPYPGKVDSEVSIEQARETAEQCVLRALSYLKLEFGDLNKIDSVIKINGYVQSSIGFSKQPKVIDAASRLLNEIFKEKGKHSRTAVGVSELPSQTPVEIEFIFSIK